MGTNPDKPPAPRQSGYRGVTWIENSRWVAAWPVRKKYSVPKSKSSKSAGTSTKTPVDNKSLYGDKSRKTLSFYPKLFGQGESAIQDSMIAAINRRCFWNLVVARFDSLDTQEELSKESVLEEPAEELGPSSRRRSRCDSLFSEANMSDEESNTMEVCDEDNIDGNAEINEEQSEYQPPNYSLKDVLRKLVHINDKLIPYPWTSTCEEFVYYIKSECGIHDLSLLTDFYRWVVGHVVKII